MKKLEGCSGSNIKKVATKLEINLPQRRVVNPSETFQRKKNLCTCCGKEFVKHSSSYGKAMLVNKNINIS